MSDSTSDKDLGAIGQHCSLPSCNLLDFLPIKCELCGLVFCKEHYSVTAHKCEKYQEQAEAPHVSRPFESFACSLEGCSARERVQVTCEFCRRDFCMRHRLQVDHKCPQLATASDKDASTHFKHNFIFNILLNNIFVVEGVKKQAPKEFKFEMKQNVSEKNSALATKLALMKLKQTAQGPPGLPEQSKYFCFVVVVNEAASSTHSFFFSTKWPLGKCIEFVESKLNLAKSNNIRRFYLNDQMLDSSSIVDELIKNNGPLSSQGLTLHLKPT